MFDYSIQTLPEIYWKSSPSELRLWLVAHATVEAEYIADLYAEPAFTLRRWATGSWRAAAIRDDVAIGRAPTRDR